MQFGAEPPMTCHIITLLSLIDIRMIQVFYPVAAVSGGKVITNIDSSINLFLITILIYCNRESTAITIRVIILTAIVIRSLHQVVNIMVIWIVIVLLIHAVFSLEIN